MARARSPIPEGFHSVTPHLIFEDSARALDWYTKAFGAKEISRAVGPDGKVMHAELQIGNSRLMLNDAMGGGRSIKDVGGSPVGFWIYVDDCDALFTRAVGRRPGSAGTDGTAGRSVLGRSHRHGHRSVRLPVDDRDAQRGFDGAGARSARAGLLQTVRHACLASD